MIYSFLLIGQSNMAGRGFLQDVEPVYSYHIKVLKNGLWRTMFQPIHWDTDTAGVCLAESFALAFLKDHPNDFVGLIPAADGGTCLDQWMPGEPLYESAVFQAKQAMRSSQLVGILWHQGEADCKQDRYPHYKEKCTHILTSLRAELGVDVPVIVGGLGDYLADCDLDEELKNYPYVNAALKAMAEETPNFAFVSAEGLKSNPDYLHFCASALREFGLRYYDAYRPMTVSLRNDATQQETVERSYMESL